MPTPNYRVQCWQATGGCILVTMITLFFACASHAVSQTSEIGGWYSPVILVWVEAIFAFACLLGLFFGDPGVVPRSLQNSCPLPAVVRERLMRGNPLDGLANVVEGDRIFCARCYGVLPRLRSHLPSCRVRVPSSRSAHASRFWSMSSAVPPRPAQLSLALSQSGGQPRLVLMAIGQTTWSTALASQCTTAASAKDASQASIITVAYSAGVLPAVRTLPSRAASASSPQPASPSHDGRS